MDLKQLLDQYKNGEVEQSAVIDAVDALKADMVPRSRLNDKNVEIQDLNAEIAKRDEQITALEAAKGDAQQTADLLEQYKQQNENHVAEMNKLKLNNAIKLAVAKEANDPDDILAFLKTDALEVTEDGTVKGLDDAITTLKESKPYLFQGEQRRSGNPPVNGAVTGAMTKQQIMEIKDPAQRQEAIRSNMNLFN
ncbi:phage scaffolding protein [Macrococcus bovicus]|uniref:Uncharacterized protein n=1 Tax=Macrococcus bovicus TaxID=69968 RepID=A0A4R6BW56_9STAP|nr:phage scaffolding protein [Macrococcus bovicus]TDM12663.1 hypothetical protein ERX55_10420 [Macrococcus bovicus]